MCISILSSLEKFYLTSNTERGPKAFQEEIVDPLMRFENTSGDEIHKQLLHAQKNHDPNDPISDKYGPMLESCGYCVDAIRAINKNEWELAWWSIAKANYWCGVVNASIGIEEARIKTIKVTRKNTAAKGGSARADKIYGEIKSEAFKLARLEHSAENKWPSRWNAAQTIAPEVAKFAEKKNRPLSPDQAATTVDGWLATMPDAKSLFRTREKSADKDARETEDTLCPETANPANALHAVWNQRHN